MCCWWGCLCAGVFVCIGGFAGEKVFYESVTAGVSTKSEWEIEKEVGQVVIKGVVEGSSIFMNYSSAFSLEHYVEKTGAEKSLDVTKQSPCLIIKGNSKGREKIKSYKVGNTPWIQDFKFGFIPFLTNKAKTQPFYIINPDNLDVHEMIATKEIEEVLVIEGNKYNTQKIKVTLKGFRKKFWTGYIWFDTTT